MRKIARLSASDRRELFMSTAQAMHIHEAIIEKDFWVCWILDYLFSDSAWKERMAFKGGTSLSKAFNAIERFSEDIDLILDWRLLGYSAEEPWKERSATKQDSFGKEANQRATEFIAGKLAPSLGERLSERTNSDIGVSVEGQDILVTYPRAFSLAAIQPQVKLEIGPLADWLPNESKQISPYAAAHFPKLFEHASVEVRTISAERTFWEKATILHQEAHRSEEKLLPPRYSRHYYDLCRLARLPIRESALGKLDLLNEVVRFKMRFYRCPWAKYEEAISGSLRLLPPDCHLPELKKDYKAMQTMLFGSIPSFEDIMAELSKLESEINGVDGDAKVK